VLTAHSGLVAVEAINHHRSSAVDLDATPDARREFARRQLGCVYLLNEKFARIHNRLKIDVEAFCPFIEYSQLLIEDEHSRTLAAICRPLDEGERK